MKIKNYSLGTKIIVWCAANAAGCNKIELFLLRDKLLGGKGLFDNAANAAKNLVKTYCCIDIVNRGLLGGIKSSIVTNTPRGYARESFAAFAAQAEKIFTSINHG